ncbi:unnamed protein product, partial [Symbiodinium necroappetens]
VLHPSLASRLVRTSSGQGPHVAGPDTRGRVRPFRAGVQGLQRPGPDVSAGEPAEAEPEALHLHQFPDPDTGGGKSVRKQAGGTRNSSSVQGRCCEFRPSEDGRSRAVC